jgi:hypothetical protein
MFKKLLVFAITSGLAAKAYRKFTASQQAKSVPASPTPVAKRAV